jgi:hypothetical protein
MLRCSLHGTTLSYWKTERDAADHPRGTHSVAQCMVYVEGLKNATFFTFRIVDQDQNILLRLSTKNEGDGRHWVSCLEVRTGVQPLGTVLCSSSLWCFMSPERVMEGRARGF